MTWWAWLILAYVVAFAGAWFLLRSRADDDDYGDEPDTEANARPLGNVTVLHDSSPKGGK